VAGQHSQELQFTSHIMQKYQEASILATICRKKIQKGTQMKMTMTIQNVMAPWEFPEKPEKGSGTNLQDVDF